MAYELFYESDLTRFADLAPQIAEQALKKTAEEMLVEIKKKVPVDTGDLRDSYQIEEVDSATILIGSKPAWGEQRRGYPTYYAPYVEFGTRRGSPKQPHFVPAFAKAEEFFQKHFAKLFKAD